MGQRQPLRVVKGMRDILPAESALWEHIEQVARDLFRSYAYDEIRTPLVEPTELFERSVGEDTDIVTKEMYTFDAHRSSSLEYRRLKLLRTQISLGDQDALGSFIAECRNFRSDLASEEDAEEDVILQLGKLIDRVSRTESSNLGEIQQDVDQIKDAISKMQLTGEVSLRPEATASVMRSYIEHRMWEGRPLIKVYYLGPMFRRERPQKGRYRQFYQIGAEAIGLDSVSLDVEIISLAVKLLVSLGVSGFSLWLNSVGCKECRPLYIALLREELKKVRDQLCRDCQRRSETNPLRVLDCKVPEDQPIIGGLPVIRDSLCFACKIHFERLQQYLGERKIAYTIQPRLVRGLDYYTRTTFEVVHGDLGAQNSLLGGGRYDGLSEDLGGPPAPGIGFSIGEDRLASIVPRPCRKPLLFISWLGENARHHASELQEELLGEKIMVGVYPESLKPKRFLEVASRLSARHDIYALIVGDQEVDKRQYQVKDMTQGKQLGPMKIEELKQFLKEKASQAQ